MNDGRPGLNAARLVTLMAEAVRRCDLDLSGATVLTEVATGAYIVTPVLAALGGARRVYALARDSRYGTAETVGKGTVRLARAAGVASAMETVRAKDPAVVRGADIVTNSGHLRPLDGETIDAMKPTAVIPLMYEAWEFRPGDVDLEACRRRGIPVAGTNERHPTVDVFSYLGVMAVKLLLDAGVAAHGSRILILCDNPFAPFLERGLLGAGAAVDLAQKLPPAAPAPTYDAILVALRPGPAPILGADEARIIRNRWPGAVVAQFWGDVDRGAMRQAEIPVWPAEPPGPGHMGILPSAVGPEPIVRLQAGGLKVGEVLWRARRAGRSAQEAVAEVVRSGFGEALEAAPAGPVAAPAVA